MQILRNSLDTTILQQRHIHIPQTRVRHSNHKVEERERLENVQKSLQKVIVNFINKHEEPNSPSI